MPSAIEAADAVRRGERSAVRAHRAVPRRDRGAQPGAERVRAPRCRRRARGRRGDRRACRRGRRSRAAGGSAVRREGPRRLRGHADDARFALVPRPAAGRARLAPRRAACAPRARSRSARPRRPSSARSRTPRAPRSASRATRGTRERTPGWVERRFRGRDRGGDGAVRDLERRRRIHAHARGLLRPRRAARRRTAASPTSPPSRYGQTAVVGALATTVADSARLLDVMAGPHRRDRSSLARADGSLRGRDRGARRERHADRVVERSRLRDRRPGGRRRSHTTRSTRSSRRATLTLDAAPDHVRGPDPGVGARSAAPTCGCTSPTAAGPTAPTSSTRCVRPGFDSAARVTLPKFGAVLRQRLGDRGRDGRRVRRRRRARDADDRDPRVRGRRADADARSWVSGCTAACPCRSRCSRTSGARPRSRCRRD